MNKTLKIIVVIIAYVVAIMIAILNPHFVGNNSEIFNTIIAIIGLTISFLQYLYANSESIFIGLNKLKVKILNPGLNWELSATMEFENGDPIDLSRIYSKVYDKTKQNEFTFGPLELSKKFINERHLNFKAGTSNFDVSLLTRNSIVLSSNSEINYRESKHKIMNDFEKIISCVQEAISKEECLTYSLKVNFKKGNPFYGLYVKSLESKYDKTDFILNFSIDNASVLVDNKSLEVTTTRQDILLDIAEDYLVLSNFK